MSRKTSAPNVPAEQPTANESTTTKYQHPQILLIDMVPEIAETLEKEGYPRGDAIRDSF